MPILLITVTVALLAQQSVVGDTECYFCENSTAVSSCSSVVSCKVGEICFADNITTTSGPSISLGCMPEGLCSSVVPESLGNVSVGGSLIGRSTATGDCSECCRQNRCNIQLCQSSSDGSWSSWLAWSSCDVSCGNGTQSRIRKCTEPSPSGAGKDCSGTSSQTQNCFTGPCPVHGQWTAWPSWGACSATCGIGLQRRYRLCFNPDPSLYASHCFGNSQDDKLCVESACPETDGGWNAWSVWTVCSATCNTGLKSRQRHCNNPKPSSGGQYCDGSAMDVDLCNQWQCPQTDGVWSAWSVWTVCSATCNTGLQTRQRQCSNPRPSSGGQDCDGSPMEVVLCNQQHCPRIKSSFTAKDATRLSSGFLSFPTVLLNEGSSFDGGRGTFTCRQSGFYFFTVTVNEGGSSVNYVDCNIRHNDVNTVHLHYHNAYDSTHVMTRDGYGAVTGSATLHLAIGDRVNVICDQDTSSISFSSFTGFVIADDP